MTAQAKEHAAIRRDGSTLTDLTNYLFKMRDQLRELTNSLLLLRQQEDGAGRGRVRSSNLQRALTGVSVAMKELLDVTPGDADVTDFLDPRFLTLGLVCQWLDERDEVARHSMEGLHGHTLTMPLSSIVEFLALQRKTGLLKVQAPDETVLLELKDGDIIHAETDNALPGERLGEILVDLGELEQKQLDGVLRRFSGSKRSLGLLLELQNAVSKEALTKALEEQVRRIFARLFDCQDTFFQFTEHSFDDRPTKVHLRTLQLLLANASENDQNENDAASSALPLDGSAGVPAPSDDGPVWKA